MRAGTLGGESARPGRARPGRPRAFSTAVLGALLLLGLLKLLEPPSGSWLEPIDRLTAAATAELLTMSGLEVEHSAAVISHSTGFGIYVYYLCAAWPIALVMLAGLAGLPGRPRDKIVAAVAGCAAVVVLNQLRLVTLFWTGVRLPWAYDALHHWIWEPVMLLSVGVIWVMWIRWTRRERRSAVEVLV